MDCGCCGGSKWSARSKCRRQINDNAYSRSAHRSLTRLYVDERQPRYRQPSHPAFDLTGVYLSFVRKCECCTTRKPSGYLRCEHLFKAVLNKASRPSSAGWRRIGINRPAKEIGMTIAMTPAPDVVVHATYKRTTRFGLVASARRLEGALQRQQTFAS